GGPRVRVGVGGRRKSAMVELRVRVGVGGRRKSAMVEFGRQDSVRSDDSKPGGSCFDAAGQPSRTVPAAPSTTTC
ncbi:MAG: hypothetical protein L0H41_10170, partial [Microlunatus sp.]|nr:hypothetical protein [Microlunatus sp.]